ncbi:Branched-chain-amino-acid aminotransferase [Thalictrum thalictroides]|uniref:Branched-chain-amino-acid aminotransferase n=1 Tax=Thalictrum thalictroides TaxID=46969 RepID=A0A7J6VVR7_THATH|nr:Branched-chain-amino-acid aminotransferase [Thalictrum thalictroides]
MASYDVTAGRLHLKQYLSPTSFLKSSNFLLSTFETKTRYSLASLKLQNQFSFSHSSVQPDSSTIRCESSTDNSSTHSTDTFELANICWDDLGFGLVETDYMYVMKCSNDGNFSKGELVRFGNIELSPSSGVLNYGQGLFEGLKAYRKKDGSILMFRPEENALRMRMGAERMCMPAPTVAQFVEAVKLTILENKRWVPPAGKGSLYIRPLLIGSGATLYPSPAPEFTFLVYVSPVGNYFKEGLAPINLVVENEYHRATPGGTGGIKAIGNYASALKPQSAAKAKGYSDVLYLDSVHKRYLEEVSSCNVFVVKGRKITTPEIRGTILPGITRKSIIDVARKQDFQVEERLIPVEELLEADEVFCTGTAVVVSPVGSVTYLGKRITFGDNGVGVVAQQLYSSLTSLQMGLTEDRMGWTVALN